MSLAETFVTTNFNWHFSIKLSGRAYFTQATSQDASNKLYKQNSCSHPHSDGTRVNEIAWYTKQQGTLTKSRLSETKRNYFDEERSASLQWCTMHTYKIRYGEMQSAFRGSSLGRHVIDKHYFHRYPSSPVHIQVRPAGGKKVQSSFDFSSIIEILSGGCWRSERCHRTNSR